MFEVFVPAGVQKETKLIPEIQYKLNSGEFFKNDNVKKVPTINEFAKVSFEIHKIHRRFLTQKNPNYLFYINMRIDHITDHNFPYSNITIGVNNYHNLSF